MKDMFVMEKALMIHIINGLKSLNLNNYEDYCKIVGIVSMLEQTMLKQAPNESEPEEVMADG